MKNIVLYSPPSAGKGTQCELLKNNYGFEVLSIGQVLRNARSNETEIGRIIIENQDKGLLVPDDIVTEALKNELQKYENKSIIIEGYPRNINQAKLLDSVFKDYIVINLDIGRDIALKRAIGRINCPECNRIYNIYFDNMKPKVDNICDDCGCILKRRDDDNEESFNVRFDIYENNKGSILDYYREKNILNIVDAGGTVEETYSQIDKIINNN